MNTARRSRAAQHRRLALLTEHSAVCDESGTVSEYQCYEFVALDHALSAKEMAELRAISTRAEISPARFWNEYHWGDLKTDPAPRNPLIAGAFHRTGAIEVWGRGTNRVIEACRAYGIAEPTFSEVSGAVTVTFKAEVVADLGRVASQVGPKSVLSAAQVQVLEIASVERSLPELMAPSGLKNKTRFRNQVVAPLLEAGLLEMTIPDKPQSSKQQYRTTDAGRQRLRGAS